MGGGLINFGEERTGGRGERVRRKRVVGVIKWFKKVEKFELA